MRFHAPYMEWAKSRPSPRFDLAGSNVLACSIDDLANWPEAVAFSGHNENGYRPLVDAIARRYGVAPGQVTTATGTSGANFLVFAAFLEAGDDVLVERPGYDPLLGAARLFGARTTRFDREFERDYVLDPAAVQAAMTDRTKLIVLTSPHNPTSALAEREALVDVGRIAKRSGALVVVDEVYLDAADSRRAPAATLGEVFITTSSLTKSYGLAALRCGWTISTPALAERIRRARDVVDGTGAIVAERLATLAFAQLDRLAERGRRIVSGNAALLREFLASRPDLECVDPGEGTVAFPRIRGVANADAFTARLMTERETAVVPGRFFEAPAHFRIGLGGVPEALRGGLAAIGAALDLHAY